MATETQKAMLSVHFLCESSVGWVAGVGNCSPSTTGNCSRIILLTDDGSVHDDMAFNTIQANIGSASDYLSGAAAI